MEVMAALLFVGVVFVTGAVLAFAWTARAGSFDHSDRLALLPLDDGDDGESMPLADSAVAGASSGTEPALATPPNDSDSAASPPAAV